MDSFIKVLNLSDLPSGSLKSIVVKGDHLAIANVEGVVYALADICTHAHCSLGGLGYLEGKIITCGCHGAQYDVTNGKVLSLPAVVNLKTYEVKIECNDIYIKL
jgi:nitrite reductase/ring-hydroxylating ferredoxin subunit